jgi:hypothetical protein
VHFTVGTFNNSPPRVAITNFTEAVSSFFRMPATIRFDVVADDPDGRVESVGFFANSTLISSMTEPPFIFVWSNIMGMPVNTTVTARVTDDLGMVVESAPVALLFWDQPGPVAARIVRPGDGQLIASGTPISIRSEPIITDNNLYPIEIFDGTNLLGSVAAPPYEMTVTNLAPGEHRLSARSMDRFGTPNFGPVTSFKTISFRFDLPNVTESPGTKTVQIAVPEITAGRLWVLETSTNLSSWEQLLLGQITTNRFRFQDSRPTNDRTRFYRFSVWP